MSRRERRLEARKLLSDKPEQTHAPRSHGKIAKFFDAHYHALQLIPLLILLAAIGYNIAFSVQHGDFVRKGVSLAGGTSVTVSTVEQVSVRELEEKLASKFPDADVAVRILKSGATQTGVLIEASNIGSDAVTGESSLVAYLRTEFPGASLSVETTGPSLGEAFFVQVLYAVLAAFVLMAVVVFLSFRTFYPSMAVVFAGFSTVVSTLAVFNLLGLSLSTAGVAAFLMLIGYSIDTDILLSTRVLRGSGTFIDNVWAAAKTGLMMQVTTATAVTLVLIFSNNPVFTQIMTIILIGMFFDVLYTWIQNAAILKWYIERREAKR